jgi:histidinol-phosphate aminotransferase
MSVEPANTGCVVVRSSEMSAVPAVELIELSRNESAMAIPPHWLRAAVRAASAASSYPDPDCKLLRQAIAGTVHIDAQRIVCGAGLMECLHSIALGYLHPGDKVVIPEHAFAFFRSITEATGARATLVRERDWHVDIGSILEVVDESTRMVIFANPANPTGTYLSRQSIVELRLRLPPETLLVIDEAYAEFVGDDRYEPLFDLADSGNTVVLRTFSKAYGLAGFRVGWTYCPSTFVDCLRRIQVPAIVNSVAQAIATVAVQDQVSLASFKREMLASRRRFIDNLVGLDRILPLESETNFVLLRTRSEVEAQNLDLFLRHHGIILRRQTAVRLGHCLRATIGTEKQMQIVASRIVEWCSEVPKVA